MGAGNVVILGVIGALLLGIILWIVYALASPEKSSSPSLGVILKTYKKDVVIEQYSLLPGFLSGEYEARFYVGAPHNLYPPTGGIGHKDFRTNDTFLVEIHPGISIHYYMTELSTNKVIFSVDWKAPLDIHNVNRIHLCDGAVVDNRGFSPNFRYRFAGDWASEICDTMILAWSCSVAKDVISDDSIPCGEPPTSLTTPYTFNTVYSPRSVGWKGAWVGMVWVLYTTFDEGNAELGRAVFQTPDLGVLVGVAGEGLKMSSS